MRPRSVGPASTDPKSTCASSNSQKRAAAMPRKVAGAGIAVLVMSKISASASPPSDKSELTSKEYQSRCPSKYSCAVSVTSLSLKLAATEKEYSSRSGSQDVALSGSLKNVSNHSNQSRAT